METARIDGAAGRTPASADGFDAALCRRLVDRLPVGVAVLRADGPSEREDWVIVALNAAAQGLFRSEGKDPAGRRLLDLAPEVAATGLLQACAAACRRDRPVEVLDFVSRARPDGVRFSMTAFSLGGPLVALVFEELSASKLGEAALARANAELAQLAYLAAHDLESPLRKAAVFAAQLELRLGDGLEETSRDLLARLERSIAGMQSLLAALLELAQTSSRRLDSREVDLDAVAADVLDSLADEVARSGASVQRSELPAVAGDPRELRLLLANLIGNALKFAVSGRPPQVRLRGRILRDGRRELLVEDDGVGFDMALAGRLFQPFQRLHSRREYPGNGMGLALCRKIVERRGGTISIESAVGRGTRVTVVFPAEKAAPGESRCPAS